MINSIAIDWKELLGRKGEGELLNCLNDDDSQRWGL
jgi:hypothetical protein